MYNPLVNGVYWGYNPLTNLLLTSWDFPRKSGMGLLRVSKHLGHVARWAGSSVSSRPARCLYSFCGGPKEMLC